MQGPKRGCGKRVAGGAYLTTNLSPFGTPIDYFLFDPPWIPKDKEGNAHYPGAVGLQYLQDPTDSSVFHVWDWIGMQYYPTFPDFWEETRRLGLSRRISSKANFDLINTSSRLIGFHKLGMLKGSARFVKKLVENLVPNTGMNGCPTQIHYNTKNKKYYEEFCTSLLWQLVDISNDKERLHKVLLPRSDGSNGEFWAARVPSWIKKYKTEWLPAAMFCLPIQRIEIVEDPVGGKHEETVMNIENSITNMPYFLVKE